MGLDAYAYAMSKEHDRPVDVSWKLGEEFWYWRKQYQLNNYMRGLYGKKGGIGTLAGKTVQLCSEDLDMIEQVCADEGEFLQIARQLIADGKLIFYGADW